jgi:hypothetical protein
MKWEGSVMATNTNKKSRGWNPFQKLEDEAEARSAAKAGAIVSGYLGLSYVLQTVSVYSTGKDTFGQTGYGTFIGDLFGVALAAFLTWRILARRPLWAAIAAALWYAIELGFKLVVVFSGEQRTNVGWIFMFVAIGAAAILGVRGSWKLRRLRRAAHQSSVLGSAG